MVCNWLEVEGVFKNTSNTQIDIISSEDYYWDYTGRMSKIEFIV